jgi:hypothetical protein
MSPATSPPLVDFDVTAVDDQVAANGAATRHRRIPLVEHDIAVDGFAVAHGQVIVENLLLRQGWLIRRLRGCSLERRRKGDQQRKHRHRNSQQQPASV